MLRKWWSKIGLIVAALLVLLAAAPQGAWAAPVPQADTPNRAGMRALGQVSAIGEGQFTLLLRDGREVTVLVDEQTRFRTAGGGEASFDDLAVGRWVTGAGRPTDQEGVFLARVVVILPEDFDPGQLGDKAAGKVERVDVAAGTFVLTTRDGEQVTVQVDDNTHFRGVEGLDALQPGMFAAAAGKRQDGGALLARVVVVRQRPDGRRFVGKVETVDAAAGTFTLATRAGEHVTFVVTEQTRYRGIQSLDEMEPGMAAVVGATQAEDGRWQALFVAAGQRSDVQRFAGKVASVDAAGNTFTLTTRNGESVTFAVTDRTRFRGIHSLDEMEPGMAAGVAAVQGEDGRWVALGVIAGQFPDVQRFGGVVVEVTEQGFTLETQEAGQVTFAVTDRTRFRGVSGLNELENGMKALVGAVQDESGRWVAVLVLARRGGQPPRDGVRLLGRVDQVGDHSLTLTTRNGQQVTVQVTDETRFRGVSGLADLQPGQDVLVLAKDTNDGYQALLVAARPRR